MLYWKKWLTNNKKEGDKKTPKGLYKIGNLYYRKDRLKKPQTSLKCIKLKKIWDGVTIQFSKKI